MKRFLLLLLSLILILNFSLTIYGGKNDSDVSYSDEQDNNLESGGDKTNNYTNTFWYGKVEEIGGKFGISIC